MTMGFTPDNAAKFSHQTGRWGLTQRCREAVAHEHGMGGRLDESTRQACAAEGAAAIKRPLPVTGAALRDSAESAGSYFFSSSFFGLHFSQTFPSFFASTQHLWLHSFPASFAFSQHVFSAANDVDMSSAVAQANAVRSLVMFIMRV
jgi:hypothetical protein